MPERVVLSRRKGWRKPENTVVVSRPSAFGNPHHWSDWRIASEPFITDSECRRRAVAAFREDLLGQDEWWQANYPSLKDIRDELYGKNLACWCPLGDACHADVLMEIANSDVEEKR